MPTKSTANRNKQKPTREEIIQQLTDARTINTLIDVNAVAFYLGQSVDWVYDQGEKGDLPVIHFKRKVAYRIADIDAWLDQKTSSTQDLASK